MRGDFFNNKEKEYINGIKKIKSKVNINEFNFVWDYSASGLNN